MPTPTVLTRPEGGTDASLACPFLLPFPFFVVLDGVESYVVGRGVSSDVEATVEKPPMEEWGCGGDGASIVDKTA